MMIEPEHPTPQYIRARITFHEDQAEWFRDHNQPSLAKWAQSIADTWRNKLETPK